METPPPAAKKESKDQEEPETPPLKNKPSDSGALLTTPKPSAEWKRPDYKAPNCADMWQDLLHTAVPHVLFGALFGGHLQPEGEGQLRV